MNRLFSLTSPQDGRNLRRGAHMLGDLRGAIRFVALPGTVRGWGPACPPGRSGAAGSDDAGPGTWMQSAERGNGVEKEAPLQTGAHPWVTRLSTSRSA